MNYHIVTQLKQVKRELLDCFMNIPPVPRPSMSSNFSFVLTLDGLKQVLLQIKIQFRASLTD